MADRMTNADLERLSLAIENDVRRLVRDYTTAKIREEMDPIYQHVQDLYEALSELAERVNTITEAITPPEELPADDEPTPTV